MRPMFDLVMDGRGMLVRVNCETMEEAVRAMNVANWAEKAPAMGREMVQAPVQRQVLECEDPHHELHFFYELSERFSSSESAVQFWEGVHMLRRLWASL